VKPAAALLSIALVTAACASSPPEAELEFLGKVDFAHGLLFDDTTVGGLSGISYDEAGDRFFVISDDRSAENPSRFYTVRITLSDSALTRVDLLASTPLLDTDGQPFAAASATSVPPDPEGIAYDAQRRQLYWSSEGERTADSLLSPWIRTAGLDGTFRGEFDLPTAVTTTAEGEGPRRNHALEGLTLTPDASALWAAMEGPLVGDDAEPTESAGAVVRLTRMDPDTGAATAQYGYPLDPVTSGAGGDNGLSDLVALEDNSFLVIERGFGTRVASRLYRAEIDGAQDILGRARIDGATAMRKTLVADLRQLHPVDNVEGITLGPKLDDGRQSVIMVTDDNFSPLQVTQFLAFAL
jgi:hypothetical protein